MKYYLILNPGSRGGKSKRIFKQIFSLLNASNITYEYKIINSLNDAYLYSLEANRAGYDIIIAVGGDGTINKVLNGFYNEDGKRNSKAKMGVIYTGTSPDFCMSYNIPYKNIRDAVDIIIRNGGRKIQIGKVILAKRFNEQYDNMQVQDNKDFYTCYFACCANIGLGATLARFANSGIRRVAGDFLGTFFSLIKTLAIYRPDDFSIICDGNKEIIEDVFNISIGLTYYVASGIKIKNDLGGKDRQFYNLIVKNLTILNIPFCLNTIYGGKKIPEGRIFSLRYYKTIEIFGNSSNPEVEFDGDPQGFLPCRIEIAEDALDIITEKNE